MADEHVSFNFPVLMGMYELDTTDPDYERKVDELAEDLKGILKGDLAPYKVEGENTPVKLRVFTKRC
jgi:hypothetical protein